MSAMRIEVTQTFQEYGSSSRRYSCDTLVRPFQLRSTPAEASRNGKNSKKQNVIKLLPSSLNFNLTRDRCASRQSARNHNAALSIRSFSLSRIPTATFSRLPSSSSRTILLRNSFWHILTSQVFFQVQ